jgi:hypothetical protein
MQNSRLYRRGIVLPRSAQAVEDIRLNDVSPETPIALCKFSSDDEFYSIWETGIFKKINDACDSIIDDYEGEEVAPEKIKAMQTIVICFLQKSCPEHRKFLESFSELCTEALAAKMPLFFIF